MELVNCACGNQPEWAGARRVFCRECGREVGGKCSDEAAAMWNAVNAKPPAAQVDLLPETKMIEVPAVYSPGNLGCVPCVPTSLIEEWKRNQENEPAQPTGTKRITLDLRPGGAQGAAIETAPTSGWPFVISHGNITGRLPCVEQIRKHWDSVEYWIPTAEIERQVRDQ